MIGDMAHSADFLNFIHFQISLYANVPKNVYTRKGILVIQDKKNSSRETFPLNAQKLPE